MAGHDRCCARRTVEHPFGTLKMRMGTTHFLMKRLPKVATEMALHVLALQSHARDENRRREAAPGGDPGLSRGLLGVQVTQNDLWELQECLHTPRAHVFKSVSGHLDQDLRTTAQAEQGIRGTSVRKLFEEAAGGGFILRSQFSPCLSMASALASR